MIIFATRFNHNIMKHLNTIVIILLNILFCFGLLWFFTRNAFLRPYAGSTLKEAVAGLLLLGSLYANYFLLYPILYQKHSHNIYWLLVFFIALATGFIELAIAYQNISLCNAAIIQEFGFFSFFSKRLLFIVGRNLAFNFFPFLIGERQHFQQAFENEVKIVYQDVRKLDVTDGGNNIQLVPIEDIFYCQQQRNFTNIFMVNDKKYTRLGSMKHLQQLVGEEEFIRITTTLLVPFRHIESCKDYTVIMKKMPWEQSPTTFKLEPKTQEEVAKKVVEGILKYRTIVSGKEISKKQDPPKSKRKPTTPPKEKINEVLSFIEKHSNCNSADIIAETKFSLSTVERCLLDLKKQGLIEHSGSKKTGGYRVRL